MSPTQLSLKKLRAENWTCCITEKWNRFARVRQDAFGFGDLLCCSPSMGIMLVQTTTTGNFNKRVDKVKAEPKAAIWLASGGRILVHGWSKKGPRGKRKTWQCRYLEVTKAS